MPHKSPSLMHEPLKGNSEPFAENKIDLSKQNGIFNPVTLGF